MKKDLILKTFILLLLGFVVFAKSSILLHEYSHDAVNIVDFDDNEEDCALCEFAKISSKIFLFVAFAMLILSGYLVNVLSRLNRLKLSYLLSSKLSRAPPAII
ncbi:MAG: hypothetical protein ISQ34_05075 [Rickettsiales bacterium]|nr:hypothetical protein [Rickettsiales bacterium]